MSGSPPGREQDPTLVRNQPALRTARRRAWLIPGAIVAVVGIGMLAAALQLRFTQPAVGIALIIVLYAGMCVVAGTFDDVRRRNLAFAILMIALAVVPVAALVLVILSVGRPG